MQKLLPKIKLSKDPESRQDFGGKTAEGFIMTGITGGAEATGAVEAIDSEACFAGVTGAAIGAAGAFQIEATEARLVWN